MTHQGLGPVAGSRATLLAVLLACLAALLPLRAAANSFDTFGFDPRAVGMGGAQVASASDFTGAWYNPALMVYSKELKFGMGFSWAQPVMAVRPQVLGQESRVQDRAPPDFGGFSLGVLFPLAGKVENRLALGLGIYLPSANVLRTEAVDPRFPTWYLYNSSPNRIIISTGASVRLHEYVTAGVGIQALANLNGGVDFKLDIFTKEFRERAIRNDFGSVAAPIAGLSVDLPMFGVRLGAAYRSSIQLNYGLPTTIDMGDIGALGLTIEGVVHYSPHTFSLGAQYQALEKKLTVSAELRYAMWSSAPDPHLRLAFDLSGEALQALGLGEALDMATRHEAPGFVDTLGVHLGTEYLLGERFAVRGGYFFRPTPVPLQTGDTNILDGDTHGISIGAGFNFDDPLEVFARPIHIHLAAQMLLLPERVAEKSGGQVASYTYGGHVNNVLAALRYEF